MQGQTDMTPQLAGSIGRHSLTQHSASGDVLLLAHGFGCDQTIWARLLPHLVSRYAVYTFDYIGAGRSDMSAYSSERYGTLEGYARDVESLVESMDAGPVTFVGHSVSATIGALASIRRPELFSSLVMLAPSACYINEPPVYMGGFERSAITGLLDMIERNAAAWPAMLAPMVMGNADRPELTTELQDRFCAVDRGVATDFARATFLSDHRADLAAVPVPALIVQCTDDLIAPITAGDFLADTIPEATLRQLAITGHCPHVSHPAEVAELIHEFVGVMA